MVVVAAGCVLARRSRNGVFQLTVEGAATFAPFCKKARKLRLPDEDALLLLQQQRTAKPAPLSALSDTGAERVRRLAPGPCLLLLPMTDGETKAAVPARRLKGDAGGIKVVLPFTSGLEHRQSAVAHALSLALNARSRR